jgi:hypothetical protein
MCDLQQDKEATGFLVEAMKPEPRTQEIGRPVPIPPSGPEISLGKSTRLLRFLALEGNCCRGDQAQ